MPIKAKGKTLTNAHFYDFSKSEKYIPKDTEINIIDILEEFYVVNYEGFNVLIKKSDVTII